MTRLENPYKHKKKLSKILYVYISEDNHEWLREQEFKHKTNMSWYVNALITHVRSKEPMRFDHDEYRKILKQ